MEFVQWNTNFKGSLYSSHMRTETTPSMDYFPYIL